MRMTEWAENEIELVKKTKEALNDDEFDYVSRCYDSALKAFKSLIDDNHSGMSFNITKPILIRLMDAMPLTPIENTPDSWVDVGGYEDGTEMYQHKRMFSFFKHKDKDGSIRYSDNNRFICIDINTGDRCVLGGIDSIINEICPIVMPYTPKKPIEVYYEDIYHEDDNQYAVHITSIIDDGVGKIIDRFFKHQNSKFIDISEEEYNNMKK